LLLDGEGPFDQGLGHSCGSEIYGQVSLDRDFTIVRRVQLAELLADLTEYAWRYSELNDEPEDGDVRKLVDKVNILINHLRSRP
jgi:hypothetical protein